MNRKNLPLIITISLPFIMIAVVALVVYLPGATIEPQHNFLYVSGEGYYGPEYTIEQGKVVKHTIAIPSSTEIYPKFPAEAQQEEVLFLHDVKTNTSSRIEFVDAAKLAVNNEVVSPDGFEVRQDYGNGGVMPFFFGGSRDYDAKYLVGHRSAEKLNMTGIATNGYTPYRFLGWVIQ